MRSSLSKSAGFLPTMRSAALMLLLCLWACDGNGNRPDDLLPTEKMADILTDIHIAEARVSMLGLHSLDSSMRAYDSLQVDIRRHNKIDSAQYAKSYNYYISNPGILADIYTEVDSNLARRERKKNIKL